MICYNHVFVDLGKVTASCKPRGQLEIVQQILDNVAYAPLAGDRQTISIRAAEEDRIGAQRDRLKAIAAAANPAVQ